MALDIRMFTDAAGGEQESESWWVGILWFYLCLYSKFVFVFHALLSHLATVWSKYCLDLYEFKLDYAIQ